MGGSEGIEGSINGLKWCEEHAFERNTDLHPCPECRVQEVRREARNKALDEAMKCAYDKLVGIYGDLVAGGVSESINSLREREEA